MVCVPKRCDRKSIGVYDAVVGAFIIATFVLENATYSRYFSIIQLAFLGYSMWRLLIERRLILATAVVWTACVGVMAVALSFVNSRGITSQTFSVIKNCIKCLCISVYLLQTGSPHRLIQSIAIAGLICGAVLLAKFMKNPNDYDELRRATVSRVGADVAGGNVNIASMNMCFAFSSWLYLVKSSKTFRNKVIAYLCLGFVAATTLLTGSRKILLFFGVSFLLAHFDTKTRYKIIGIVGIIALYVAMIKIDALYFIIGHKIDFFNETAAYGAYEESDGNRIQMIVTGLRLCWEYPLGTGFGGSNRLIGVYTHNNFIEVLLSLGIIGFIVYYAAYYLVAFYGWKKKSHDFVCDYMFYTVVGLIAIEIGQVTCLYTMPVVFLSMGLSYMTGSAVRCNK